MTIKVDRNKFQPERIKTLVINYVGFEYRIMNMGQCSLMNYMETEIRNAYGLRFDKQVDVVDHFNKSGFYFIDLMLHTDDYDDYDGDRFGFDDKYGNYLKLKESAKLLDYIPIIADKIKQFKPATIAIVSDKIESHVRLAIDLSGCSVEIYVLPRLGIWPDNFVEKFKEDLLLIEEYRVVSECEQYIQHRFFDTLINGGSNLYRKENTYSRMRLMPGLEVNRKYELSFSEKFRQSSYEISFDFTYDRKKVANQMHQRGRLFRSYNAGEISEDDFDKKLEGLRKKYKKKYWIFGGVKDGDD